MRSNRRISSLELVSSLVVIGCVYGILGAGYPKILWSVALADVARWMFFGRCLPISTTAFSTRIAVIWGALGFLVTALFIAMLDGPSIGSLGDIIVNFIWCTVVASEVAIVGVYLKIRRQTKRG
jgi:hypothetical protein